MGEEACPDCLQGSSYQKIQNEGRDGGLGVHDLKHDCQQGHTMQQHSLWVLCSIQTALLPFSAQYQVSKKLV